MPFDGIFGIVLTCVIVVIIFSLLVFLIKRYKKCPSDKVMVIYGKVGSNKDGTTKSACVSSYSLLLSAAFLAAFIHLTHHFRHFFPVFQIFRKKTSDHC